MPLRFPGPRGISSGTIERGNAPCWRRREPRGFRLDSFEPAGGRRKNSEQQSLLAASRRANFEKRAAGIQNGELQSDCGPLALIPVLKRVAD